MATAITATTTAATTAITATASREIITTREKLRGGILSTLNYRTNSPNTYHPPPPPPPRNSILRLSSLPEATFPLLTPLPPNMAVLLRQSFPLSHPRRRRFTTIMRRPATTDRDPTGLAQIIVFLLPNPGRKTALNRGRVAKAKINNNKSSNNSKNNNNNNTIHLSRRRRVGSRLKISLRPPRDTLSRLARALSRRTLWPSHRRLRRRQR